MNEEFAISTDKQLLNITAIHAYLSERSYWAKGRSLAAVRQAIDHSLCFGMVDQDKRLVGFARVVTDYTVFAFLMDVFILEEYRGRGLGKRLIAHILDFPALQKLKRWQLLTADAHGLYERFGFGTIADPLRHMEKVDRTRC